MFVGGCERTGVNPFGHDVVAELRFNARVFELARHNGYALHTFHTGRARWWTVPTELREVAGASMLLLA